MDKLAPGPLAQAIQVLRDTIWYALDNDLLSSAAFNAERLLALDPDNKDSKHLFGLVLYRQRRFKSAANITSGVYHTGCIYVYAKCCLELKMYAEGISALEQSKPLWNNKDATASVLANGDSHRSTIPDAQAINIVLGHLYNARSDKKAAVKAFASSARSNPYLWESVEQLCNMGINLQLDNLYKVEQFGEMLPVSLAGANNNTDTQLVNVGLSTTTVNAATNTNSSATSTNNSTDHDSDPFSTPITSSATGLPTRAPVRKKISTSLRSSNETPTSTHTSINESFGKRLVVTPDVGRPLSSNTSVPLAPQKRSSRNSSSLAASVMPEKPPVPTFQDFAPKRTTRTVVAKRAANNANTASSRTGVRNRLAATRTMNGSEPNALFSESSSSTSSASSYKAGESQGSAQLYLVDLYTRMTNAYFHFCKFKCKQALQLFDGLPENQKNTPWVLSKVARLHYELANYNIAKNMFLKLRALDRCRLQDMDYFSTTLWHLRDEAELSFLAHELMEIDRTAPQAWCALGNTFSLLREVDQSLKCFKRAIYLDPSSPYAYTLQAHEYINTDSYENAQESFRQAIHADSRHYNAWYGLGMVYMRLGFREEAESHFLKAASINPSSVTLMCCIGIVYERQGHYEEALKQYRKACEIQPDSAMARYRRARVLIHLKLYDAALEEFDHLSRLAPDEAKVHFLLGQLYKTMQKRELAVKHFTYALNLDPKGGHLIKEALGDLGHSQSPTRTEAV